MQRLNGGQKASIRKTDLWRSQVPKTRSSEQVDGKLRYCKLEVKKKQSTRVTHLRQRLWTFVLAKRHGSKRQAKVCGCVRVWWVMLRLFRTPPTASSFLYYALFERQADLWMQQLPVQSSKAKPAISIRMNFEYSTSKTSGSPWKSPRTSSCIEIHRIYPDIFIVAVLIPEHPVCSFPYCNSRLVRA